MGIEIVYLSKERLVACENSCLILLGFRADKGHAKFEKDLKTSFLVTVKRGMQIIQEGETIYGSLNH
jgi:hypothetical protein